MLHDVVTQRDKPVDVELGPLGEGHELCQRAQLRTPTGNRTTEVSTEFACPIDIGPHRRLELFHRVELLVGQLLCLLRLSGSGHHGAGRLGGQELLLAGGELRPIGIAPGELPLGSPTPLEHVGALRRGRQLPTGRLRSGLGGGQLPLTLRGEPVGRLGQRARPTDRL